jgi:hypothetical protein
MKSSCKKQLWYHWKCLLALIKGTAGAFLVIHTLIADALSPTTDILLPFGVILEYSNRQQIKNHLYMDTVAQNL